MNMVGSLNLKFTFCFMDTTHEPLYLDEQSLVQQNLVNSKMQGT
jgi:hypothetical protein